MKEKIEHFNYMLNMLESLKTGPQTLDREYEKVLIKMELVILEGEIAPALARLVLIYLGAWRITGRFTAIRDDGMLRQSSHVIAGNEIQNLFNLVGEARTLAKWSLGVHQSFAL